MFSNCFIQICDVWHDFNWRIPHLLRHAPTLSLASSMAEKEIKRPLIVEQDARGLRIGIVSAHAHAEVIGPLVTGTKNALIERGVARRDIAYMHVLRPYDLPFAAKRLIQQESVCLDGAICLGLLVREEHQDKFDFQSEAVAEGIMKLNVKGGTPVVYGVLTCVSNHQAKKFIGEGGGVSADHGFEWAKATIELIRLSKRLERDPVLQQLVP